MISAHFRRYFQPLAFSIVMSSALFVGLVSNRAGAQPSGQASGGTITLRSDVQEANANTGIVTATGNVQIDYPEQEIFATAAQAQYYSNERRIVLSGNVVVNQEGNTLRAETVTYLVDEGRFVALPQPEEQVEATYIVPASDETPAPENGGDAAGSPELAPIPSPPPALELDPIADPDAE
ncbi:MAG: LptA/OstA family protein [Cyanobacteria bacterium P01_A01_bin.123]